MDKFIKVNFNKIRMIRVENSTIYKNINEIIWIVYHFYFLKKIFIHILKIWNYFIFIKNICRLNRIFHLYMLMDLKHNMISRVEKIAWIQVLIIILQKTAPLWETVI